ncbi:MAG: MGMT family protein [Candidatus Cloacimonadales bacterium]|nr:MGMT family protein [Candidatus Cloacimonadales bacterium]
MLSSFSKRAIEIMKRIPAGKVGTYGQIATYAGDNRGAQLVVRLLKSSWEKENLPWHRVVNSRGFISLPTGGGYELQKSLLQEEGVEFDLIDRIDFDRFLWKPLETDEDENQIA